MLHANDSSTLDGTTTKVAGLYTAPNQLGWCYPKGGSKERVFCLYN